MGGMVLILIARASRVCTSLAIMCNEIVILFQEAINFGQNLLTLDRKLGPIGRIDGYWTCICLGKPVLTGGSPQLLQLLGSTSYGGHWV